MPSGHHRDRSRSRSPHLKLKESKRRSRTPPKPSYPIRLPLRAQPISKRDLEVFRPLFALYLDVQKQIDVDSLDDRELRGRWKSFVKKWNTKELAEGWYDSATKAKAEANANSAPSRDRRDAAPDNTVSAEEQDQDSDDVGPALPRNLGTGPRRGPAIPSLQDLDYRKELQEDDRRLAHEDDVYHRKQDRKAQKERIEELAPRADPGSRERQLEKRRETTSLHAGFRDAKEGGEVEMAETDLLGDDGVDAFRRKKVEEEKKKSERQLRKEEIWRARAEEREEKLKVIRDKESTTMNMLKALAKERFG